MKLTLRGEYALRALLVLGLHYGEAVVPIGTVSTEQNIPRRFLEQILNDLLGAHVGSVLSDVRRFKGSHSRAKRKPPTSHSQPSYSPSPAACLPAWPCTTTYRASPGSLSPKVW